MLNIPAENITLVNASQLQDDPSANWKSPIIAKQILKQVHSLDIDVIITFDREGVSHHPNHCAIFYSSVSVYVASLLPDGSYFAYFAYFATHEKKEEKKTENFSTSRLPSLHTRLDKRMPKVYIFI